MKKHSRLLAGLACLAAMAGPALAHTSITASNLQSYLTRCQNGDGNACEALADVLRNRHDSEQLGIPYNPQSSLNAANLGCKVGHVGACFDAAKVLSDPQYNMVDIPAARAILQPLCSRGIAEACNRLNAL